MTRGILSIYWGDESKLPIDRLKLSVSRFHPELPHEIIKVDAPTTRRDSLYIKSQMMDMSPFEETLFLDIDTVIMGKLNFGFTKAQQFGLAVCVCEAPWARRYRNIFLRMRLSTTQALFCLPRLNRMYLRSGRIW